MELNDLLISYSRLSKDDPERDESSSIYYQRQIISSYVQNHADLNDMNYEEIYDDGYSGTNLERPGIQRVLELVKQGRVKCIVVKDISRFSRDFIDIGRYLERIFPFMDIRFISISDEYDSKDYLGKPMELDMKFKSILADYYCKDTSQKIIDELSAKKSQGKFIAGSTPFGYSKSKSEKHKLVIEPREAEVVKRIFLYALDGLSVNKIARKLNEEGIPTPLEFQKMKKPISRESAFGKYIWSGKSVHNILTNEAYVGTMTYDKYRQVAVGGKKKKLLPSAEWKRVYKNHEPIIEDDIFDAIQEKYSSGTEMQTRGRKYQNEDKYPLMGKLFCGGCKRTLYFTKGENMDHSIKCRTSYLTQDYECYEEDQTYEEVSEVVLFQIKQRIKQEMELSCITITEKRQFEKLIEGLQRELADEQSKHDAMEEQIHELLIQYHRKQLSEMEFLKEKSVLDAKGLSYERYSEDLKHKITEYQNAIELSDRRKDEIAQYGDLDELTMELVSRYIEKVFLYQGHCKMEIVWKKEIH